MNHLKVGKSGRNLKPFLFFLIFSVDTPTILIPCSETENFFFRAVDVSEETSSNAP